jgi:hypothetical protein
MPWGSAGPEGLRVVQVKVNLSGRVTDSENLQHLSEIHGAQEPATSRHHSACSSGLLRATRCGRIRSRVWTTFFAPHRHPPALLARAFRLHGCANE